MTAVAFLGGRHKRHFDNFRRLFPCTKRLCADEGFCTFPSKNTQHGPESMVAPWATTQNGERLAMFREKGQGSFLRR